MNREQHIKISAQITFVLLLSVISSFALAQETISTTMSDVEPKHSAFTLTAVAGYAQFQIKGQDFGDQAKTVATKTDGGFSEEANKGATGGMLAEYGFGRKFFAIESGLIYFESGSHAESPNFEENLTLRYLGVPLLAKLNFRNDSPYTTSFKLGVMPAFVMDQAHSFVQSKSAPVVEDGTDPNSTDISNMDVFAVAGLNILVPVARSTHIYIGGNYMRGLISPNHNGHDSYNEGFLISLGLGFDL